MFKVSYLSLKHIAQIIYGPMCQLEIVLELQTPNLVVLFYGVHLTIILSVPKSSTKFKIKALSQPL